MAEIVKKNFESGKPLLAAVVLLSINLVIQLVSVADNIDLSNGLHLSGMAVSMTVSYLLTAISMIIVLQEFFQVKTKMRGLVALSQLLGKTPQPETREMLSLSEVETEEPVEEDLFGSLDIDEDSEFDDLLDELDADNESTNEVESDEEQPETSETSEDEDIMARYKTTKIKIDDDTGEIEPLIDEGGLQDLIEQADLATEEAEQLAKIVAESEIIQTLNELETIVQEMKTKKAAAN